MTPKRVRVYKIYFKSRTQPISTAEVIWFSYYPDSGVLLVTLHSKRLCRSFDRRQRFKQLIFELSRSRFKLINHVAFKGIRLISKTC